MASWNSASSLEKLALRLGLPPRLVEILVAASLFLLFVVKGFCFGGLQFLPVAMLADVIDVDAARSGGRRAGTYFAFLGFTEKIAIAFGTGIALNIVGLLGFDPKDGVAGSTEIGVLSLRLVYCLGPVLFYSMALKLIWNYPLTPVRHARLRERIERRNARLALLDDVAAADTLAQEP